MDIGTVVTFSGIVVAALAGVLGVWMERDREAPPRWAWVFSGFIVIAMFIEIEHSVAQAAEDAQTEEKMVRVFEQLSELASKGGNPALEQFVAAELAVQARANPDLVRKLEENIEAKGADPNELRNRVSQSRRVAAGLSPAGGARMGKAGKAGKAGKSGGVGAAGAGKAGKSGKAGKAGAGASSAEGGVGAAGASKAGKSGSSTGAGASSARSTGGTEGTTSSATSGSDAGSSGKSGKAGKAGR